MEYQTLDVSSLEWQFDFLTIPHNSHTFSHDVGRHNQDEKHGESHDHYDRVDHLFDDPFFRVNSSVSVYEVRPTKVAYGYL